MKCKMYRTWYMKVHSEEQNIWYMKVIWKIQCKHADTRINWLFVMVLVQIHASLLL